VSDDAMVGVEGRWREWGWASEGGDLLEGISEDDGRQVGAALLHRLFTGRHPGRRSEGPRYLTFSLINGVYRA
jgi:hypothetical protein